MAELDAAGTGDIDALLKVPVAPSSAGLLAPIARLFSSPSPPVSVAETRPSLSGPKPEPTAALAPTTVNVAFTGSGKLRRAVSVAPKAEATTSVTIANRPPLPRQGLRGLFVGGGLGPTPAAAKVRDPWVMLPNEDRPPPPGQLLQRTLRPRGLSDSSIHTTFDAHAGNPVNRVLTPAGLALSSQGEGGSATGQMASQSREAVLASLSERVKSFRAPSSPTRRLAPSGQARPIGISGSQSVGDEGVAIRGESLGVGLATSMLGGWTSWAAGKTTSQQSDIDQRPFVAQPRRRDPDH